LIEEAYERGKREGVAAVQTDYDIKLVEQRTRHVMETCRGSPSFRRRECQRHGEQLSGAVKDMEAENAGAWPASSRHSWPTPSGVRLSKIWRRHCPAW